MPTLTATSILTFLASVLLQVATLSMLPSTKNYTVFWPTLIAVLSINVAMWLFARLIANGVHLSVLVPIAAAVVPLCQIAVGICFYGETAPVLKVVLLVVATGLIGFANRMT
jgi:multidrug transporter EmrE-like cation transporter